MTIYSLLIIILWLCFISYWLISAMSAKKNVKGSRLSYGLGHRIALLIIIILIFELPIFQQFANYYGTLFSNSLINILGVVLCVLGIAFAIWARRHLGRNWGMPMSIKQKGELITTGPYVMVRHPIYSGMLLAIFGSMLVGGFIWLVYFIACCIYFFYSSRIEDGLMAQQFPTTYPDYKKKTKALIPFLF